MPIEVTLRDKTYRTDDLTLDEAIEVEKVTGESWLTLNPFRSALHCRAIMVAFLKREMPQDEAEKIVGNFTAGEAESYMKVVEDDLPTLYEDNLPLSEAGTSTAGSSGLNEVSAGPPQ